MSKQQPPAKRTKYDLDSTFDVMVGTKIFSLHTTVFERSEFFRAARKPEWLQDDPNKPVDLEDEDAEVFNAYINCVYFGPETLVQVVEGMATWSEAERADDNDQIESGFYTLIHVYHLADKLQDLTTTNLVIDELIKFREIARRIPGSDFVSLAYRYTAENSPLRSLMRDYWVYHLHPNFVGDLEDLPEEFIKALTLEFYRAIDKSGDKTVDEAFSKRFGARMKRNKCHYHQHDDKHPRCVPKPRSGQDKQISP